MGQLKKSRLSVPVRSCKSPRYITEQLAFQKLFRNSSTINSHKGHPPALAVIMDALSEHLFSCSALSNQKNIGGRPAVSSCRLHSGYHNRRLSRDIAAILDKAVHIFFIACQYILKLPSKGQVLPVYSKDRLRFPVHGCKLKIRVNQQNAIV